MRSTRGRPISETISETGWLPRTSAEPPGVQHLALVVAWSLAEPHRVGEVLLVAEGPLVVGRGDASESEGGAPRARLVRQRPGVSEGTGPLRAPGLSRHQLVVEPRGGGLAIERHGRCEVLVGGRVVDEAIVRPGETVTIRNQLVLLCARRPQRLPELRCYDVGRARVFGAADEHGIVGESPAIWSLRDELAFAASSDVHVLLLGASGAGKELAAAAIHAMSARRARPLVARSAATFPPGLVDAELFGNARDYPNAGMPERPGLVGEADGGALFLDEIGELDAASQAHLLRVLDRGGEYTRLGEARPRRASLRLVAATNRAPSEMKPDLLARLALRARLPGLDERREDIPLLATHLLRRAAARNPTVGPRFFERWDGVGGEPRVAPEVIEHLLVRAFSHHARELEALLWEAIRSSRGTYLEAPAAWTVDAPAGGAAVDPSRAEAIERRGERTAKGSAPRVARTARPPRGREPTAEELRAALARHAGQKGAVCEELGLSSRFALYRLLKRHGIDGPES